MKTVAQAAAMVDYSKWDALEVSSDDDDYVDKPNSKEAYRRIGAATPAESRATRPRRQRRRGRSIK